jgi:hypothetical protein
MMRLRIIAAVTVAAMLSGGPAFSGVRDDVINGVTACGKIANDRQWLDCYYGAAQPMRARLGLSPVPTYQEKLVKGIRPIRPPSDNSERSYEEENSAKNFNRFGLRGRQTDQNIDRIDAVIVAYTMDNNHIFTATLSNGQIWQQLLGDTTLARWYKSPRDFKYRVEITRGALGSFDFRVAGLPGSFKVRRIR